MDAHACDNVAMSFRPLPTQHFYDWADPHQRFRGSACWPNSFCVTLVSLVGICPPQAGQVRLALQALRTGGIVVRNKADVPSPAAR